MTKINILLSGLNRI